jgi:hypothetical protein
LTVFWGLKILIAISRPGNSSVAGFENTPGGQDGPDSKWIIIEKKSPKDRKRARHCEKSNKMT